MSEVFQGWVDDQRAVRAILSQQELPYFDGAVQGTPVMGSGRGKVALLYEAVQKTLGGQFNTRYQKIGDCVSMGAAYAVDVLRAIQYVTGNGEWVAETATEPIYAMSRVEIGRGALGSSDGSTGAWAAEAVKKLGTLVRKPYGTIDLTTYSGDRARTWGLPRAGCPDELEPIAREHLVRTVSLVRTWDELCDAVAAGYPVTIASTVGFANQTSRDSEGFLKPSGSWAHQMCVIGLDDAYRRPGALIINSWGPWISGPKRHNQPDGSFWADRSAIERILAANDSWAYSDYLGFPLKKLDWSRAY
jgi:hypothetical protein